jgi:hypothetical protein
MRRLFLLLLLTMGFAWGQLMPPPNATVASPALYASATMIFTGLDAGATNAYVVAAPVVGTCPGAYADGLVVNLVPNTINTTSPTFNFCSLGALAIKTSESADPVAFDIMAGSMYPLRLVAGSPNYWRLSPRASVFNLFAQTASMTVGNTASELTLVGAGTGTVTIPANMLTVGRTLRLRMWGFHSSTANPTVTVKAKLGSVTIGTATGSSGNGSTNTFDVWIDITCRSVGATGTVFTQGLYQEIHTNGLVADFANTAVNVIDTTAANAINVTFQWGTQALGNTITATNFTIEKLN